MDTAIRVRPVIWATAIIFVVIGLYLAMGGGWLAALGGSLYYLITGLALVLTAVLLLRGSPVALWLYALILLGTLIWAIREVGFDFWPLAPRGGLLVVAGIWLLMPWIGRNLKPGSRRHAWLCLPRWSWRSSHWAYH